MRLFNTLGRAEVDLAACLGKAPGDVVSLYTCGPTVYNYLHVGNYRTYVFEDVLKRTLKLHGYRVRHVMNITDVGHLTSQADDGEDKMAVAARREGKTAWDIANFYEKTFLEDIARLNVDFHPSSDPKVLDDPAAEGDILCRATEHVPEQIDLVRRLEAKGLTYEIPGDGVYFDTGRYNAGGGRYEKLIGGAHVSGLQEGARVAANEAKRGRTDFALWKFSRKGERQMEWEFPGRPGWFGFPGWHVECSAMAERYLGKTFDIHCGGVDHIPIHHTNEIAQSEGANGVPFARLWLHGEFLLMNKEKMAKSAGGFIRLQDLASEGFEPLDFRFLCYSAHYRKQLDFSWAAMAGARAGRLKLLEKAREVSEKCRKTDPRRLTIGDYGRPETHKEFNTGLRDGGVQNCLKAFRDCIGDDLGVPGALALVHEAMRALPFERDQEAFLNEVNRALALGLDTPTDSLSPDLAGLFENYKAARARKDFPASDALRKQLAQKGIKVLDSKEGSKWQRI